VRLLLDCHISKASVRALRKKSSTIEAEHLATWREGAFLRSSDEEILLACHEERRAFVTFDQRTIPDLLRRWAAEERPHSGVIFGDENSIKPNNPGALARALAALERELAGADLVNAVRFLRREKH